MILLCGLLLYLVYFLAGIKYPNESNFPVEKSWQWQVTLPPIRRQKDQCCTVHIFLCVQLRTPAQGIVPPMVRVVLMPQSRYPTGFSNACLLGESRSCQATIKANHYIFVLRRCFLPTLSLFLCILSIFLRWY